MAASTTIVHSPRTSEITPFQIETPPQVKKSGKIKSLSGQILTFCNQNQQIRTLINPNNKGQGIFSKTIGKIIRYSLRFFVGMAAGMIGGAFGTLWHLSGAIIWGGSWENRVKHLKSAGADAFRFLTSGFFTGIAYASNPDLYFEKGYQRSDHSVARPLNDSETPLKYEASIYLINSMIDLFYYFINI